MAGTKRSHPLSGLCCSDSLELVAGDAAELARDRAHRCAAPARVLPGSRASARSAYARLASGSSLSHAIHNKAAMLPGSRTKIARNARLASAFCPFCAAASPSRSRAAMWWSMGIRSVKGYWRLLNVRLRSVYHQTRLLSNTLPISPVSDGNGSIRLVQIVCDSGLPSGWWRDSRWAHRITVGFGNPVW
jgi:hypothetical protein